MLLKRLSEDRIDIVPPFKAVGQIGNLPLDPECPNLQFGSNGDCMPNCKSGTPENCKPANEGCRFIAEKIADAVSIELF
jgi:hypothetical protein